MSNVTGPILLTTLGWILGIHVIDAIFKANKLGGIENPITWWMWPIIWIVVITIEIIAQRMIATPPE